MPKWSSRYEAPSAPGRRRRASAPSAAPQPPPKRNWSPVRPEAVVAARSASTATRASSTPRRSAGRLRKAVRIRLRRARNVWSAGIERPGRGTAAAGPRVHRDDGGARQPGRQILQQADAPPRGIEAAGLVEHRLPDRPRGHRPDVDCADEGRRPPARRPDRRRPEAGGQASPATSGPVSIARPLPPASPSARSASTSSGAHGSRTTTTSPCAPRIASPITAAAPRGVSRPSRPSITSAPGQASAIRAASASRTRASGQTAPARMKETVTFDPRDGAPISRRGGQGTARLRAACR